MMTGADYNFVDEIRTFKHNIQAEINTLQAAQNALNERVSRFERRHDDDTRLKSVWSTPGQYSSGLSTSTPLETPFNPAAEAFKTFEQQQGSAMMGSLSLETDDEPRRGASRANSVRFDDSVLRFSHSSRASSELFSPRLTGPSYSGGALTERSSSHKSDGRQSSLAQSIRSNRSDSGLGDQSTQNRLSRCPPPGISALGPLPSIIRCWATDEFNSDTLVYAAICSGSFRSTITSALVQQAHLEDELHLLEGRRFCSLKLSFAEASILEAATRFLGTANGVPFIIAEFMVLDTQPDAKTIPIIIGSDILRRRSADLLLSQDRLSMIDENGSKLSIPLVRPENIASYSSLVTVAQSEDFGMAQPITQNTQEDLQLEPRPRVSPNLPTVGDRDISTGTNYMANPVNQYQSLTNSDRSGAFSLPTWRSGRAQQDTNAGNLGETGSRAANSRSSTAKPMKVLKSGRTNHSGPNSQTNTEAAGWRQRDTTSSKQPLKNICKGDGLSLNNTEQEKPRSASMGAGLAFEWLSS